ncbi:MAG TPA: AAA family ATPase [Anaerolineae bacterium]|nr:AAA family ATPase [Anaerolineae bacterium]
MSNPKHLPIGIQTFPDIIAGNYLYIDKTKDLYQLINRNKGVYFLSRPRRFGKSLLISTLAEIFAGNRHLFTNLWIATTDYNWQTYPVLRFDFSQRLAKSADELQDIISTYLHGLATQHGITLTATNYQQQLIDLIQTLAPLNADDKVVILIDEYDKPILDNIENGAVASDIRDVLKGFYTVIKSLDAHLRFVFLTGISKFSKVGVFSGLNNLEDLTLQPHFATLLGITHPELEENLQPHLEAFSQYDNTSISDLLHQIRTWYNGFRFASHGETVYNPFSLFLCLKQQRFANHWFETGTPTFLLKLIRQRHYDVRQLDQLRLRELAFSSYDVETLQIIPLLFQTGYLTIKNYEKKHRIYTLDYPNYEVSHAFMQYLLGDFAHLEPSLSEAYHWQLIESLQQQDINRFFDTLHIFFANIPYDIQIAQEKYYQTIFYLIFRLMGLEITAEARTNRGRIDAVVQLDTATYLFEFKLNDTAANALKQIKSNDYFSRYRLSPQPIYLIGVQFDLGQRTIGQWEVETYDANQH